MTKKTEDEVFEYYQNDLPEDFKVDRSKIRRKKVDMSKATVQISLKLENDLLVKLRDEGDKQDIGYQTLMKQIIRDYFHDKTVNHELAIMNEKIKNLESNIISIQKNLKQHAI